MARPVKDGLDYFPLVCAFDSKVQALEDTFGNDGLAVFIKLLQEAYTQPSGEVDVSSQLRTASLAKRAHLSLDEWEKIVAACCECGLFDKEKFEKEQIITSAGVKKHLKRVLKERKSARTRQGSYSANNSRSSPNNYRTSPNNYRTSANNRLASPNILAKDKDKDKDKDKEKEKEKEKIQGDGDNLLRGDFLEGPQPETYLPSEVIREQNKTGWDIDISANAVASAVRQCRARLTAKRGSWSSDDHTQLSNRIKLYGPVRMIEAVNTACDAGRSASWSFVDTVLRGEYNPRRSYGKAAPEPRSVPIKLRPDRPPLTLADCNPNFPYDPESTNPETNEG